LYEQWANGEWVNSSRWAYTYDASGNTTSFWHYKWVDSTWTPANLSNVEYIDSAGNYYYYSAYSVSLVYKIIVTGVASDIGEVPADYFLSQNYPNPFNPSTTLKYELPRSADVTLSVYDMLGREVSMLVNERKQAGTYIVRFDGSGLSSGVYFYRLTAGNFVGTRRGVLLR